MIRGTSMAGVEDLPEPPEDYEAEIPDLDAIWYQYERLDPHDAKYEKHRDWLLMNLMAGLNETMTGLDNTLEDQGNISADLQRTLNGITAALVLVVILQVIVAAISVVY